MFGYNVILTFSLIFTMALSVGTSVKINELRVPEIIRFGTDALLDCDYTLEDSMDNSGLVVKWYFNDQSRPVYQWIPGAMKPQGLGILKNKLNLDYRASNDARTMHRALNIIMPTANLSGEYSCVVSTFQNEDKKSKTMLVFVPERSLLVSHGKSETGVPNVMCTAAGVFPQPEMTIRMGNEEIKSNVILRRDPDGLYGISAEATLDQMTDTNAEDFACELRVSVANYTVRREFMYYPGNAAHSTLHQGLLQYLFLGIVSRLFLI